ncbi:MAG: hypothetical protein V1804_02210 [Patescibacteria group bacterium]
MPRETRQILRNQIEALKIKLKEKDDITENLKNEYKNDRENIDKEHAESIRIQKEESENKIKKLESLNKELDNQNKEKQKQLDFQETKKLAKAYEDQKEEYKENSKVWVNRLFFIGLALAISTIISVILSHDKMWYDRFEYYSLDIILISAVWFCVSQYSYYIKLYSDFANRQALAQSYHNIINSADDASIKDKFLDKSTDILCAHNSIEHKDNLPVEKITSGGFEVMKEILKKIP